MQRSQVISIALFIGLFSILYFACSTKTKEQEAVEKSRAENLEILNIDRINADAIKGISGPNRLQVTEWIDSLALLSVEEDKVRIYEQIASLWYNEGRPLLSAYYAEKIADLKNTEETWQITGTSYLIAAQRLQDDREKQYAVQRSRLALEKAISLNASNIENRINLALTYVEQPLESNPMKGILMLVDLNKENLDNIPVLMQLGRLAMGTNQLDKAVERLSRVTELDPDNRQAHCYLEEIYTKQGKMEEAAREKQFCEIN